MTYPHVAEAALLAGPKSLHRFAPAMMFVFISSTTLQACNSILTFSILFRFIFNLCFYRHVINIFIIIYQVGSCCIYVVFISKNIENILKAYDAEIDVRLIMLILLLPLILINWVSLIMHHQCFACATDIGILCELLNVLPKNI